ncbi:MAG: hypothetical protein C4B59_16490 [Candidatus Methanogaster sp.]|uniref:Uncharacterized protein n=1 Tax=Candidatus Methanogaster sp. TaxID=3386292 RepID=A0AC61KY51_9EURY|nr:MAG: hypothetical protein C4B59_16490 [ANME-2 cluster archaeon]
MYNLWLLLTSYQVRTGPEIETDNNAMTRRVVIEEGGFGNRTGPRGTGGGSNPTGGEYTEEITGTDIPHVFVQKDLFFCKW